MDLRSEMDGFYAAMMMSEIEYCRENGGDMSYKTVIYMDLIWSNPGCTVGRLAEILGIDKAAVSRKIDVMVRQGLVVKGSEGRSRPLCLSDRWQALYDAYDAPYRRAVEAIESEMSPQEVEVVCRALRIMSDRLAERAR